VQAEFEDILDRHRAELGPGIAHQGVDLAIAAMFLRETAQWLKSLR